MKHTAFEKVGDLESRLLSSSPDGVAEVGAVLDEFHEKVESNAFKS